MFVKSSMPVALTLRSATSAFVRCDQETYQSFAKVGIVAFLVGLLYFHVLTDLAKDWWQDPNLSYGMLMPPFAFYLAWAFRKSTLTLPKCRSNRGLFLIAGACGLLVVGKIGAEFFLQRISFVLLLTGIIWTFFGFARMRNLGLPLLLLATMVPLPTIVYNSIAAPLQLFASRIATSAAQSVGTSAYRDGNIIVLANMSLGVEEACSGLNALSSLLIGSIILGFFQFDRSILRWCLVSLAIPLAIFVNVLRVAGTAILADHYPDLAMGYYHTFAGWLVFILGFAGLYLISVIINRLLNRREVD